MAVLVRSNPEPDSLVVLHAPFDVVIGEDSTVQPDLMVFDSRHEEPSLPLLAVEIVSPSTRHIDIGLKWSRYASAGIPDYWVVDPGVPSAVAWQREHGTYTLVAEASADENFIPRTPWPVDLTPRSLTLTR